MMNSETIYFKTDKGRVEMATRGPMLDILQRRMLILIDGKRSVADLQTFVRAGELEGVLEHLEEQELIAVVGSGFVPISSGFTPLLGAAPEAAPSMNPVSDSQLEEFKALRQQVSDFVSDRLGSAAEPACDAIERCESSAQLKHLLPRLTAFIGKRLSPETTQAFADHFGALLP